MEEKLVYHYCGVETFLNIIRNHTLRLSDLCISTDNLEMKSLLEIVRDEVKRQYKNSNDFNDSVIFGMKQDVAFFFLLDTVITKMKNEFSQILYGTCFSEEGDLLGQWREYADKGRGLSIGFRARWFERLCKDNDLFKFAKVIYENSGDISSSTIQKLAGLIYDGIIVAIVKGDTKLILDKSDKGSYDIAKAEKGILQESIFVKRAEYSEEKEWRLIIEDENTNKYYDDWREYYNWKGISAQEGKASDMYNLFPNALEFMVRGNRIVSYLDMRYDTYQDELPIEKIIIGPNCKVTEGDVFHLLEFYGFDGNQIEIVKSKSSYCV